MGRNLGSRLTGALCLLLGVLMALGGVASAESQVEENRSKALENRCDLVMYLIGSETNDFEEVMEALNEKLDKDLNCTLTINHMSWSDWATKYPLVLVSGEQADLIYASDWAFYAEQARKGAFEPILPLVEQYAPALLDTIPAESWN